MHDIINAISATKLLMCTTPVGLDSAVKELREAVSKLPERERGKIFNMAKSDPKSNSPWTVLFLCWFVASVSTMGSLFFSHVMEYAPCVLCWYQRICLFPLVIILAAGLFPFDKSVVKYALPLSIAGWLTALYHNLLYAGIIPESIQPCGQGVPCTEEYIALFGFLTIPMLSLLSFSTIIVLLVLLKRMESK